MEKLSLDKFSDKKLENMKSIEGGKAIIVGGTTWANCDHHGVDWIDDEGNVGGYLRVA